MKKILQELNEEQRDAATTIDGPILILAGAGSGKTKTITTRLAYLISIGIDPASILTLTFTNKAAKEMRERALALIDNAIYPPLLCTFHKFGLLFLKFHISRLGRDNNFVIIDTDDKKRILKSFKPDLPLSLIASEISKYKNSLISPSEAIASARLPNFKKIANLYQQYEEYLLENNLVDFDDLLALTYKILDTNEDLREETSKKYSYIMIDEFQDTNELQNLLIKQLCSTHSNICVVGDDDQSIYGWRGANVKNILEFPNTYKNVKIVKLEKNYRSTKKILEAANNLIAHNRARLGKKLEATKTEGEPIVVLENSDEQEEAHKIGEKIIQLISQGVRPSEIAVLFRINALSRSIEEAFNRFGINFKLVGAIRFYERAEVKDILSYLRVITNPNDDFSLKRIINKPKRGIGKATYEKLEKAAKDKDISVLKFLWEIEESELLGVVGKKNAKALLQFIENLKYLQNVAQDSLYNFIDEFEKTVELKKYYASLPDGFERIANIDEFYGMFRDYIKQNPENSLDDFINELSLQSDQDQIGGEGVSIMSVHASKGLEFEHLFVIGLEEGFFPLTGDGCDIEEERRLGYVAITRAKKELTLSYVKSRFYKGRRTHLEKSRFLGEAGLLQSSIKIEKKAAFKKGDLVKHKIFGIGRVIGVSKAGKEFKLTINFGGQQRDILSSFVERV
ncbi:DNA helicase II / ATP-dependent DNA helicase PcrA [Nitratiruptor sp. YY08-26]|uniref:ATP-dependent helicase n=1 Tax=unclassified Nitratiruptor TaxID=2624044 RepID=UPI001915CC5B|nr:MULTISPECIES: UvrD-helicase domain-containing protein [unclassified Nitratiruptor]BCD62755.1 DNA helicase II / ATP-dependent DNA helicase PcrA [Nitratiruptor sp. YY08-13]BCD66691.1 DNA helicase II / ATP-dependent DNA helicase PcrA [Nitratiruptor sp. YY08-26]